MRTGFQPGTTTALHCTGTTSATYPSLDGIEGAGGCRCCRPGHKYRRGLGLGDPQVYPQGRVGAHCRGRGGPRSTWDHTRAKEQKPQEREPSRHGGVPVLSSPKHVPFLFAAVQSDADWFVTAALCSLTAATPTWCGCECCGTDSLFVWLPTFPATSPGSPCVPSAPPLPLSLPPGLHHSSHTVGQTGAPGTKFAGKEEQGGGDCLCQQRHNTRM